MAYPLNITKTTNSKLSNIDFNNLPFGKHFGDHMFVVDYVNGEWVNPEIVPFEPLSLSPSCSALHYGQSIFEGMKAQRDKDNNVLLFRPMDNIQRLNKSAIRMAMPEIPENLFLQGLEELLSLDREWIPTQDGSSLYIRPFMFANDDTIGIKVAESFKFIIFTSPVGRYYSEAVKVLISDEYVRAFPGGTGFAKAAGNYAATLMPVQKILDQGYRQILWLDGIEKKYLQEIGTMNVFLRINDELITPDTNDGTILEGVTRASVIDMARDMGYTVTERKIEVQELMDAANNGSLVEAFGTGTAATIAPIKAFGYHGEIFNVKQYDESETLAGEIKRRMTAIKRGELEDNFGWIHQVPMPVC